MTAPTRRPKYQSVVLDVDSTLCGIEGIDWLAQLRGKEIAEQSKRLTDRAMNGEIPLETVYGERLSLIRPTRAEVEQLGAEYRQTVAPGAAECIRALRGAGVRLVLISGGLRKAIQPVALELGFSEHDLFAVDVIWNAKGEYTGYDVDSPLAKQEGKLTVVRGLRLSPLVLAVGDGMTDLAMRPRTDAFAAFTGFVSRDQVVERADMVVKDYADLGRTVLGE